MSNKEATITEVADNILLKGLFSFYCSSFHWALLMAPFHSYGKKSTHKKQTANDKTIRAPAYYSPLQDQFLRMLSATQNYAGAVARATQQASKAASQCGQPSSLLSGLLAVTPC
jgi:hypothetical protein